MTRIGGSDVSKNIYNILRYVLSHELALKIRYTGNTGKIAFGSLRLANAVRSEDGYHEVKLYFVKNILEKYVNTFSIYFRRRP